MRPLFLILPLLLLATVRAGAQITTDPSGFRHVVLEAPGFANEFVVPQVSTDLSVWQSLAPSLVDPDGSVRFSDFGSAGAPRRFYRALTTSSSGGHLVYERRAPDGSSVVLRCNLDGTNEKCLTPGRYPRVSPDGRWVLFARNGTGPSYHFGASLYYIDLNAPEPAQACGYTATFVFNNTFNEEIVNFAWESDNSHFVLDCGGRIYRTSRSGGPRIAYFSDSNCIEAMPSFRPDGGALAFAHRLPSQITTRSLGQPKNPLTSPGLGDSWPQWSPDGTRIVICDGNTDLSRTDLGHDLVLVDPVTKARTPLTQLTEPGDGFPQGGVWSANSLWIYAAGTVDGVQGVWRVPANGGPPQPLTIVSPFDPAPGISSAPVAFIGAITP
jgi:Tol biopolymer transport system component